MQEIVGYLTKNPEVLNKVIEGNASLIGVSQDQTDCVINAFKGIDVISFGGDWKYWGWYKWSPSTIRFQLS